MIHRRIFMRNGALAFLGLGSAPRFLYRAALASGAQPDRRKVLVLVYLNGGADGLDFLAPFQEKEYYRLRPSLAIPQPSRMGTGALDLDGFFGFHPALEPLLALYRGGRLGIVNSVGYANSTRSHFAARERLESGAPSTAGVRGGWMNRYLQEHPVEASDTLRAVSTTDTVPMLLQGTERNAHALGGLRRLGDHDSSELIGGYRSLYLEDSNTTLTGAVRDLPGISRLLARVRSIDPAKGATYNGAAGIKLREVSSLIKADVGLEFAFVELGGWDTHSSQQRKLPFLLQQLAEALVAFDRDLGDRMEDVVLLTVSEFGRTVGQNGSGGTDHGHAGLMLAMGGSVKGGRVYGRWPGLDPESLSDGRDLMVTTDFRQVFSEVLRNHRMATDPQSIFPGFQRDPSKRIGIV